MDGLFDPILPQAQTTVKTAILGLTYQVLVYLCLVKVILQ